MVKNWKNFYTKISNKNLNFSIFILFTLIFSCCTKESQFKPPEQTGHRFKPILYKKKLLENKEYSNKLQYLSRDVTKINWFEPNDSSFSKAAKEDKIIIIYIRNSDSFDCSRLESLTFLNNSLKDTLNNNFLPIIINTDKEEFKNFLEKDDIKIPSFVFFTPLGAPIGSIDGFYYPDDLLKLLNEMALIRNTIINDK